MYTESDMNEVNARIRRDWLVLIPVLLLLAGAYVYALAARVLWLAMTAGPLLVVVVCFVYMTRLWPNLCYRGFLRDMESGLSRTLWGTIVALSDVSQRQDGAMVLPVRIRLDEAASGGAASARVHTVAAERLGLESGEDTEAERIVYLNASKRAMLPEPGAVVTLCCFGRHIRSVEAEGA